MLPLDRPAALGPAPAMTWRTTADGALDHVDEGWLRFTGRALADELGEGWKDRVHLDDLSTLLETARAHTQRREAYAVEFRLLRADGEYRWLSGHVVPRFDAAGICVGFAGSAVDIDDRLARSNAGAEDFFELSLDNLCVAGLDGYFRRVNPAWTRTLGWTTQELLSRPTISFVHPDDRAATLAGRERLQLGSPLGPLVNRYLCKDGGYRWFEWRSFARADHGLVYASARDVTEQRVAEQQLAEARRRERDLERQLIFADRMASVGTLAAGVAHEINNPLAYVSANLALILEALDGTTADLEPRLGAELRELATEAQGGGERIRRIVRSLGVFSRAEEESRTVVELSPLVAQSIAMTANEIRHRGRLVTHFGPTPRVEADESRLGQVFVNLLLNAAQAIPEGDGVAHEIHVTTSTDDEGHAVIEVQDSGVGIPPELLERVFDPFFTTKPVGQGTGLGLSICHTIVAALGGTIAVTSAPGHGATFRVVLPAAPDDARSAPVAAPPTLSPPRARATVLVIDDEPAVGTVLSRVLRDHDVTAVTSAREALRVLASGRAYDIVFSDLMMPEMSGMELYEELERRFPAAAARVVFMTGGAFTPAARAFAMRVRHRLVDKPFDAASLREMVTRSADGGAVGSEPSPP